MDSPCTLLDIVRCKLCNDKNIQNYCDVCHVKLCKPCIGEHISDEYDKHNIVPLHKQKSTMIFPTCILHSNKACHLHCKTCNVIICVLCIASNEHKGHDFIVLEEIYKTRKKSIEKNAEEIEKVISPTYKEIRRKLNKQIANLDADYKKVTLCISEQGEKWHREVDRIITEMMNDLTQIKKENRDELEKHLNEIKQKESLIKGNLSSLKDLEKSNDVSLVVEYKPSIEELRKLPAKVEMYLPSFFPKPINGKHFYEMIGSLIPLILTEDENGYKMKSPEDSPKELLDVPEIISMFNTGYRDFRSISLYSEEDIWTSGKASDIKCFDRNGECMKTITTKSGEWPSDIAVTSGGDLVYCDFKIKTLYEMKNGKIEEIIRLCGWTPVNICVTSADEFLVAMCSDDTTQSKVVRFSGYIEKQTIQFDAKGKALYSGNSATKHIAENKNHDICVADCGASTVVVVDLNGKLRFIYTGYALGSNTNQFLPTGITTDSQSRILIADSNNHCIHILDKDGQFLHFLRNIRSPHGMCVDTLDHIYVASYVTGIVQIVRYLKDIT